jgi:lysophospholipase L1-like esterase
VISASLAVCFASGEDAPGFALKNGDTVVFYGDSITEQNLYNQFVELYTVTRFPTMRVHFYGAGNGGDRVSGGSAGTVDERLARDVFPHKPTVVTVMLGMNDASYRAADEGVESEYVGGYQHLLESIREHNPGVRITLLGPSAFDDVTRPPWFSGGYNAVLRHYADLDEELSRKSGGTFVNLNRPLVALLEKGQALDPKVAQLILPDRVHPESIAHWVMAATLLKGWNAPSLVAAVTIDAQAGREADVQNAIVEGVKSDGDSLRWQETDKSLPLPFSKGNAFQSLLLQLSDIQQSLNREPLRVTGLVADEYKLEIDGNSVGTFSANELASGINLADYDTPMRGQAQVVSWLVRDRSQAHYVHTRMLVRNADVGNQAGKGDIMDAFEDSLEDAIYQAASPKTHAFKLTRVSTPSK